jgi:hypothetical protein
MTLEDLLAELRENILHDRSDRISGQTDRLWSDATLVRYINEAQKRFARLGLVLRDASTPEVTQVTLATGVDHYALHPSVLAVISAKHADDTGDMVRTGHAALGTFYRPTGISWDPAQYNNLPPGKPTAYSTDEEVRLSEDDSTSSIVTLRVHPAPSADYNGDVLNLRVVRLPIDDLTTRDMCAVPEIPAIHHIEMLDWAAYLALRIVDHDLGDPGRAHEFRSLFNEHVTRARKDAMRKMFAPLPWGFGRNGYSWES